jgi:hypothetical protein
MEGRHPRRETFATISYDEELAQGYGAIPRRLAGVSSDEEPNRLK